MLGWRNDAEVNLTAFCEENGLRRTLFSTEYYPAPQHRPPRLPYGKMGVYGFLMERLEEWLKIGKLGPKSQARSVSHHYLEGNAASCLPRSIWSDPEMSEVSEMDRYELREWILQNISRMNILISAGRTKASCCDWRNISIVALNHGMRAGDAVAGS